MVTLGSRAFQSRSVLGDRCYPSSSFSPSSTQTGQRYDVLVRANATVNPNETFWVRATVQSQCCKWFCPGRVRTSNDSRLGPLNNPNLDPDVRGVLTYNYNTSKTIPTPQSKAWNVTNPTCDDISNSLLKPNPLSAQSDAPSLEKPSLSFFLNYTFPEIDGPMAHTLVNGQLYHVDDAAYPTLYAVNENATWVPPTSEQRNLMVFPDEYRGKAVRIILQSVNGRGSHPFHMHGHGFRVVASGVGSFDDAALTHANSVDLHEVVVRDTVTVPDRGWVVIQWVFSAIIPHCSTGPYTVVSPRQSNRRQSGRLGFALSRW